MVRKKVRKIVRKQSMFGGTGRLAHTPKAIITHNHNLWFLLTNITLVKLKYRFYIIEVWANCRLSRIYGNQRRPGYSWRLVTTFAQANLQMKNSKNKSYTEFLVCLCVFATFIGFWHPPQNLQLKANVDLFQQNMVCINWNL